MLLLEMRIIKRACKALIGRFGYDIVPAQAQPQYPVDLDEDAVSIARAVKPYTLTSVERLFALVQAVRYVVKARIPGAIAECGVWRGGSMMAVALTLKSLGVENIDLYLFDTFEGMPSPQREDVDYAGVPAHLEFARTRLAQDSSEWCRSPIEDVEKNLRATGYKAHKIKFVKGKVEETIPGNAPQEIAILRLDTDWYGSTRHELIHLYPRLTSGGVLIIDDYGHWRGSRQATDEYFAEADDPILLNRIDYTGRIGLKYRTAV